MSIGRNDIGKLLESLKLTGFVVENKTTTIAKERRTPFHSWYFVK